MTNKLTAARPVPRAIAGATVSASEAALRSITDLERNAARTTTPEPLGVLAAALAGHHDPTQRGVLEFFRMYRAAFPNLRMELEHVLASGDMAVARLRATGTHRGELVGMPATGRSVDVQLIDIMRFDQDGLVAEQWGVVDMLAVMQQLGVAGVRTPA
jgi:predicted ester cyclase